MIYTVLDLETTGIDVLVDEPVQLAAMCFTNKGFPDYQEIMSLNIMIKPKVPIHEKALAVHGISEEILKELGMPIPMAVSAFIDLIWRVQPCCLVGYNIINFDLPMLWNWLAKYNITRFKFPPITQIYDVMFMSQVALGTRKWPKLAEAAKQFGITVEEDLLHEAMADVELTWKIFKKLMKF